MGKGSKRRPCLIPEWQRQLRWLLAYGRLTEEEYNKEVKEYIELEKEHKDDDKRKSIPR